MTILMSDTMFSQSLNDTSRVIRMTIVGDITTWSITYDCHSDNSRGVIYNNNIFIVQATYYATLVKIIIVFAPVAVAAL